jgi:hypothetical protein
MPDPAINYDVAFSAIRIRKTRSSNLGKDTVYIKMSVAVDGKDKGTVNWDGTSCMELVNNNRVQHSGRDFKEGYFDAIRNANNALVGISTGPITGKSAVKVTFLVLNSGNSPNNEAYVNALDTLEKSADEGKKDIWHTILKELAEFAKLLFANCDGPVAADSFTITGQQIREHMAVEKKATGNDYYNKDREYQGTDSPAGCGGNSNYDAVVQFTVHH